MSNYTSFAVAGAGLVGSAMIKALAALPNTKVTVLARSASTQVPSNATLQVVDYTSPSSLQQALAGVEVVISALSNDGLTLQADLAKSAKEAGVKLFVPSEYGTNSVDATQGPSAGKAKLHYFLKSIGLDYALIFNGGIMEKFLHPAVGFDFANGVVTILGKGDTPINLTAVNDIARFVSHVLTTVPPSQLSNSIYSISADSVTFNQVVTAYTSTHPSGAPLKVVHQTPEESQAEGFLKFLLMAVEGGMVQLKETNSKEVWSEWKPKTVEDFVKTL